ncbi:helix-turn-helix transcriptional regulator [Rothia amarae]|uniref:helix-turn-helix domain-containing protein n=1 Tax=Rothia amarae TaxID=169480 RepID=UPI0031D373A2
MSNLNDIRKRRPAQPDLVVNAKERIYADIRSYKLRELRKAQNKTQVEMAQELDVSQNRISKLENGEIDRAQIDTIRRYVESLGGSLNVEATFGDTVFKIA